MTLERLKAELEWLRTLFQVLIVIDGALTAFIFQPTTSSGLSLFAAIGLAASIGLTVAIVATVYRRLNAVE
jgi:hypothetical protein